MLIGIAFVGGAFGAFAGMIVFHHKTRKMKFRILVPIAIIIWLTLGGFLAERDVVGLTKTDRPKNEYNGTEITPYHSSVDKDGDGTDDQTDILTNALVYVKKRPVYKSRYYQTGYPDDRYGVCTDVVGYALKKSGYDTTEDIPKMYKGDSVYKNYDLLTVSAPCCVPVFTKTMRLASGVVQATGISRSDYYYDDAWNQANHEEFYRKYPEAKGKKVILWAPTFRGNAAMPTLCGMEEIQRVMKETEDRYYWVIKLHPHLEEKGMKSNCDLPSEKIFAVADLLITDYSSILFDYMAYKKPFLFFAPDFDSFDHARGFYVPYDSFPCKVVTDGAELPAAIEYELSERDPAEIEKCFAYHMSMCDGKATERILKTIKQITHNASSQI